MNRDMVERDMKKRESLLDPKTGQALRATPYQVTHYHVTHYHVSPYHVTPRQLTRKAAGSDRTTARR